MSEQYIERRFKLWLHSLDLGSNDALVLTPREQQLLADAFFAGANAAIYTENGAHRGLFQRMEIEQELKARQPEYRGK